MSDCLKFRCVNIVVCLTDTYSVYCTTITHLDVTCEDILFIARDMVCCEMPNFTVCCHVMSCSMRF
jgi:hypothetical protein